MKRYVQDPVISKKFKSLYREINGGKKDSYATFKKIANTIQADDQDSVNFKPVLQ